MNLNDSMSKLLKGADELKNHEIEEVDYLVDKLIPRGTLCSLVGESDTGKSSLQNSIKLLKKEVELHWMIMQNLV